MVESLILSEIQHFLINGTNQVYQVYQVYINIVFYQGLPQVYHKFTGTLTGYLKC
jgi:hypothetical protein